MARVERITGFDDLAAKLATLKDDKQVGAALRAAVRSGLTEVVKDARKRIPVGSVPHKTYKGRWVAPGFARRSIRVIVRSYTNQKAVGLVGVRTEAFYAVQFLELGTSKMAARPWLRPAFEASKNPAIAALGQGMRDWITAVAQAKFARALNPRVRTNVARDVARAQSLLRGLES